MTERIRWTFETDAAEVTYQDSGQAAIIEILEAGGEEGRFVRLQSWRTETSVHPFIDALAGRHVRVTVEVIE